MTLAPGQRLGPYEVLSPLGAGGMGEVYKARDVRLERFVAVKVLPEELAANPDRLRRFELEARAASALEHPNIVTIFDIGAEGSVSYLAMQLVDGRTLRDVLMAGPLPVKKLLDYAVQIADAIAVAHDAGIVHRDLKPGNLMVSKNGFVKLLDFGLARREPPMSKEAQHAASTATSPPTVPGAILGTVGYMSPEQARGDAADYRSDQFSFGSILYEMATGARAFQRPSAIETLTAILNEEPEPIGKRRPDLPTPIRWIIDRCLAKSPADRYVSTLDLARDLRGLRDHLSDVSAPAVAPPKQRSATRWIFAAAAVAIAALGFTILHTPRGPRAPEFRRLTFRNGLVARALFVPRSNSILYTAAWDREPLGTFFTLPEAKGADRRIDAPVQLPMAYTADGSQVLVLLGISRASLNPIGKLAWWPALGGQARPILDAVSWADWARRGHFFAVVRTVGGERVLEIRDEGGGNPKPLFRTAGAISWVRISPDESQVAFIHHRSRFDDSGEVRLVDVSGSGSPITSPVFESCVGLAWNEANGDVYFTAAKESIYSTSLWSLTPKGALVRLYSFPDFLQLQDLSGGQCLLTGESGDTKLLVRRGDAPTSELSWLGSSMVTDLSHDGKSVVFIDGTGDQSSPGTWVRSLEGGEAVRVADGEFASFSPDDSEILTTSPARSGPAQVILVSLASGSSHPLTREKTAHSFPAFLGKDSVLFGRVVNGRNEIWRVPAAGGDERPVVAGCDKPAGSPSGQELLCIGGERDNVLFVGPLAPASGGPVALRSVYQLPPGARFVYARWDSTGGRIHVVTTQRRILTVDPSRGAVVGDEPVLLGESIRPDSLLSAAMSADAALQAYSVSHLGSQLYLFKGL